MRRLGVFAVFALVWSCGRSQSDHDKASPQSPGASSAPLAPDNLRSASATDSLGRPQDATPSGSTAVAPAGAPDHWQGSYKSMSGQLYIPPDWKNVRWNVKETAAGIGEGTIGLSVDPSSGRAHGTLDGPLGPAIVDGLVSEGKLTATVSRKEPADQGFTGTLVASISGDQAEGTMSLTLAEASAVRHATFALSRGGQAAPR